MSKGSQRRPETVSEEELDRRWALVFDDKMNKTHIVKKLTRLCCTPMAPRCEECEAIVKEYQDAKRGTTNKTRGV